MRPVDEKQHSSSTHHHQHQHNDHKGTNPAQIDSEDSELLAAAAAWAGEGQEEPKPAEESSNPKGETTTQQESQQSLSLHVTQLPFDTNELDLRRLFAEKGCSVTSIRLVYDRDERGRKTVFRGVAFCDVADVASYNTALQLHRKCSIRGRKPNIRPTRTHQELAAIVSRTQDLVKEQIRAQRDGEETPRPSDRSSDKKKIKKKEKLKLKKKQAKAAAKASSPKKLSKHDPPSGEKTLVEKGHKHKLTKKERNRRAAIINGMKKKRRY